MAADFLFKKRVIRAKRVDNINRDGRGNVICNRSRLVAKGFSQTQGVNFLEVSSLAFKDPVSQLLFAIPMHYGWHRLLPAVKNAFINAPLQQ